MTITRRLWLLAIPAVLSACGGDVEEVEPGATDDPMVAVPVEPDTAPAAGAPPNLAVPAGAQVAVALAPAANSGVTGEATLSEPTAGQAQVMVHLEGLQPNSAHAGHIHSGTCASLGPVVEPLPEATADASGMAMVNATASLPLSTVANGSHLIAYHERGGEDHGPPVVCGEIPAGAV